jgi:hypothetical protein
VVRNCFVQTMAVPNAHSVTSPSSATTLTPPPKAGNDDVDYTPPTSSKQPEKKDILEKTMVPTLPVISTRLAKDSYHRLASNTGWMRLTPGMTPGKRVKTTGDDDEETTNDVPDVIMTTVGNPPPEFHIDSDTLLAIKNVDTPCKTLITTNTSTF